MFGLIQMSFVFHFLTTKTVHNLCKKTADCGLSCPAAPTGQPAYAPLAVHKQTGPRNLDKILLVMKLTVILLTAALVQVHAAGVAQSITMSGKGLSLKQVFSTARLPRI